MRYCWGWGKLTSLDLWESIAKKRILSVLDKRRITYSSHLEIKISEAGPNYMRAEPHIINTTLKALVREGLIKRYDIEGDPTKLYIPKDFGSAGDISRAKHFNEWRNLHSSIAQRSEYCGYVLEKIIYDAALETSKYHVMGCAPSYNDEGKLVKDSNSEILTYQGNKIYKADKGSGFDLFLIHKSTGTPIGIEAKNIREWVYPASVEVWRTIARGCTLNCLPVLIARKISFIAKAGFFANFGMLGYNSNFQFLDNSVLRDTGYKFKRNVMDKDYLGFADIKLIKPKDKPPDYIVNFFENILDNNAERYFNKFMEYKDILKKYAIDYEMAEHSLSQSKRYKLYLQFKEEVGYDDITLPIVSDT